MPECMKCGREQQPINHFIDDSNKPWEFCNECVADILDWVITGMNTYEFERMLRLFRAQDSPEDWKAWDKADEGHSHS